MLEEHRVTRGESKLGDRDDLALDLTGGVRKAELRHVAQPRCFGPPGVRDHVLLVERGAAGAAASPLRRVLSLAPLTFDPVHPGRPFCSGASSPMPRSRVQHRQSSDTWRSWPPRVAEIVAERRRVAPGYADGGLAAAPVGVPHSAQNLAVALRLALQLVQCFCVGVPHSGQNFAPTWTGFWQLPQAIMAAGGAAWAVFAAGAGGGGADGGGGGGACCAPAAACAA